MTDVMTVEQAAARWGVLPRRVRGWLARGLIPGAVLVSARMWLIPADAQRPVVKTGRPPLVAP